MRIALRIVAGTWRGLREGVPNLMRLFSEFQVRGSFFLPLGRDLSGRRPWRTWQMRDALGLSALSYGTLQVGPDLAEDALRLLQLARQNGHEAGLYGGSPVDWARRLAHAPPTWVGREADRLWARYAQLPDAGPTGLATPDWQVNPALLKLMRGDRYRYTSFSRGRFPYLPVLLGERSAVAEIPTTLPTVDEALRQPGVTLGNVHEYLYAESRRLLPAGHVFTVHAELEGLTRLDLMERLVVMWKGQDGSIRALADVLKDLDETRLPHHQVGWGEPEGGRRHVAMQSVQVPA